MENEEEIQDQRNENTDSNGNITTRQRQQSIKITFDSSLPASHSVSNTDHWKQNIFLTHYMYISYS